MQGGRGWGLSDVRRSRSSFDGLLLKAHKARSGNSCGQYSLEAVYVADDLHYTGYTPFREQQG